MIAIIRVLGKRDLNVPNKPINHNRRASLCRENLPDKKNTTRWFHPFRWATWVVIPSLWLYVHTNQLAHIRQPIIERLVVHYDFFAQYSQKNGFNYLHELINNSDSVTILTLCVSHKILIQRNTLKLKKLFVSLASDHKAYNIKLRRLCKLWKQRKTYKNGFSVFALYKKWFDFFNECSVTSHWLLDFSGSNIMMAHPYETDKVRIVTGVKEVMDS